MAGVAIQVIDGEARDDGSQEGDQDEHDGGKGVEVQADAEGAGSGEVLVNGSCESDAYGGDYGEEEREAGEASGPSGDGATMATGGGSGNEAGREEDYGSEQCGGGADQGRG